MPLRLVLIVLGLVLLLGAQKTDSLAQFLLDAVALSLLGGLLGFAVGMGMARLVDASGVMRAIVSPSAVPLDFSDVGVTPDNREGMTFGPLLRDGRQTLIVVSDNHLGDTQVTQFLAPALRFETIPLLLARAETPGAIDGE